MAQKIFNASWMGQWKASTDTFYGSGSPVRVGGNEDFESFLGIPPAVRDAIKTSKTTPKLLVKMYIYDSAPEWSIGGHKLTSNPASGKEPWYVNLKTVHNSGTAWQTFDLSAFFQAPYLAGTYQGIVFHSGKGTSWFGAGHNTSTYPVQFVVEGTWNSPPPTPTITYPKGGETIGDSVNFQWNKVTDPDGDALTYRVAFHNGSVWKYYTTSSNSYGINTTNEPETSNAQLAVQAYDGQEYSPYRYSEKFSIVHNKPPTAPTQMNPANGAIRNRTEGIRFSWKHNDDGAQAGYRLAWRIKGNTTWNYVPSASTYTNSTNQYYDMPANTLPFADIEWFVRTKDQQNLESPTSTYITFKASNASNAPVILSPRNLSSVNTSQVAIEWSSLNQLEYTASLLNTVGQTLWTTSGTGSTKRVTPTVALANNTTYKVNVRVKDSTTLLWSDISEVTFTTSFSPPAKPVILEYEEAGEGVANIFYEGRNPAGTPVTDEIEVFRREYTSTDTAPWVKIGELLSLTGSFLDYTIASGQNYEYKVRARNLASDTSNDSDPFLVLISFTTTFIQEANNLTNMNVLRIVNSREEDFEIESELSRFAGRRDPVREFGEHETTSLNVEWEVDTFAEVRHFKDLMRKRDVLLFRDGNGRRMWVTTGALTVSDKEIQGFILSTDLTETSFREDLTKNENDEEWF